MVLALPTPSGKHSHFGMYKRHGPMGDTLSAWQGLRVGDTPTTEGFNFRKLIEKGARRLVFELPTLSGGHYYFRTYKRQ